MKRILIVDDQAEQAQELTIGLERILGPGWTYEVVTVFADAAKLFSEVAIPWDIVIMDLILRDEHHNEQLKDGIETMDGIVLSRSLLKRFPQQPIVLVTASIVLDPEFMKLVEESNLFNRVIEKNRLGEMRVSRFAESYEDWVANSILEIVGTSRP